jgi:hypothetical protein
MPKSSMKKLGPRSAHAASQSNADRFFKLAEAAMRRVARQVTAENKRLGLPLIVSSGKARRAASAR